MKKRSLSLSASFGLALGSVLALALLPLAPVSRNSAAAPANRAEVKAEGSNQPKKGTNRRR